MTVRMVPGNFLGNNCRHVRSTGAFSAEPPIGKQHVKPHTGVASVDEGHVSRPSDSATLASLQVAD